MGDPFRAWCNKPGPCLQARLAPAPVHLREWPEGHARSRHPKGRRGRRENSVSHGRLHERKKCKRGSSPRKPEVLPASRTQWSLQLRSHDPRWTDRTIHRWRTLSPSLYLRWHAFQTKPPRRVLVASGRLAGTMRLQPLRIRVRYARCPQPPFPIRMSNTPRDMPYLWIETIRNIILVWGGSMTGEKYEDS